MGEMKQGIQRLNEKILKVERRAAPEYVINRSTRKFHRILSAYADAGSGAVAVCGFAYAKPGAVTRFESEVPADIKWEEVCGNCLPDLRASLKKPVVAAP